MQLSASTLPYDPPAASAADPALASDRTSRSSNSETPADGFGAMLVAKSTPSSAAAKPGANARAKNPSSPLGTTVAEGNETDPAQDDATAAVVATDPEKGEGAPDVAALANWLAANAVLPPLAVAPVADPAGLELLPATPAATGGVEEAIAADADSVCAAGFAVTNQAAGLPATKPTGLANDLASTDTVETPATETTDAPAQATPDNNAAVSAAWTRFGRLLTPAAPGAPANAASAGEQNVVPTLPGAAAQEAAVVQASTIVDPATSKTPGESKPAIPTAAADATASEDSLAAGDLPATVTEKFAALQERFLRRYSIGEKAELKKPIAAGKESVTGPSPALGINAAQPVSAMPALTLTPSSDAAERISAVPAPLTFDALVKDAAPPPPAEVSSAAARAVDSVMAIADHFGTGGQRAVSLQFTVSGVELAVHVELRGNAVHTTFRTDSPELRAALAAEWQAVNPANSANRSQWIADPVFSSSASGNGTSGNAGSGFQQHADARNGQPHPQPQTFAEDLARLRSPLRAAASTSATAAPTRPVVVTSTRLHAFA